MAEHGVQGAVVESVAPGSLAAVAGILPGDVVTAINGQRFTDLIDYRFLTSDEVVELDVRRGCEGLRLCIEKDPDEGLGITFTEAVFDGIRKCRNACVFCFLHQMPRGLRPSLYVPDDDVRLSVTHGNYVTLTNVSETDLKRITALHLSPLYVSVHATDPEVRQRMLRCRGTADVLPVLCRLAAAGIELHCQVVLCPGYNDGPVLDQTVGDLAALWPGVASVAVVPVGLTRFRDRLVPLQPVDGNVARRTLAQLEAWRERLRTEIGTRFVFPSDELYLAAGASIPPREAYEGFPQTEDGIGLARLFLDELERVRRLRPRPATVPQRILLVTGVLALPLVRALAEELGRLTGHRVEAVGVLNRFFGDRITVAGLLTGQDVRDALLAAGRADRVYLPAVMLNEDRFLDDLTPEGLAQQIGVPVHVVPPWPMALAKDLLESRTPPRQRRCPESAGRGLYLSGDRHRPQESTD